MNLSRFLMNGVSRPLRVAIEHDLAERKRFGQAARRRDRPDRHLDDDRGLRLERACPAPCRSPCRCPGFITSLLSVGDGQITRTSRPLRVAAIDRRDRGRQPRQRADDRFDRDVGDVRQPRRERRFLRDRGRRDLRRRRAAAARSSDGRTARCCGSSPPAGRSARCGRCGRRAAGRAASARRRPASGRGRAGWLPRRLADDLRGVHARRRSPRPPSRRRRRSSARGSAGSRTTATCTHWFSTTGFAGRLSAHRAAGDDRRAEARRGSPRRTAGSTAFWPKSKTGPDAPVGRNSQPVTLSVSSPASASAGQLEVAAVAGQQQHAAELRILDERCRRCRAASAWNWFRDESSALPSST